jgi:diguanylate cyclase (GGDEF)-like protein
MGKSGMSRRFWYLASMVMLGALALGAELVWNSYTQYAANDTNLQNLRRFHSALLVMSRISAERGPANSAMTQDAGAEPFAASLQVSRTGVDHAIDTLSAELTDSGPSASVRGALSRLDTVRDSLARARGSVDSVIRAPTADRNPIELQRAIEAMFGVVDVAEARVGQLGAQTTAADPAMARTVIVSTLVTELRDIAGRLGSQFIVPLQTREPPGADQLKEIVRLRARIEQMRSIIAANMSSLLDDRQVATAWELVNARYFGDGFRLLDELAIDQPGRIHDAVTPAEFTARLVPAMTTLQGLRDEIITATFDHAANAKASAWRTMMISACLTGLLVLTMACIIFGMQLFLFQPLLYIRDQIMALALGTPGEIPMPAARGEEIREVLTALRLLRESQRAKLMLERERDELNLRLKALAETDPLTGTLNRRALDNAIRTEACHLMGIDGAMGLILLDLDHFKTVNDVHGHIAGDLVLQETARRIRQCVGSSDLVARFGGEEFAIVIAQPTMESLQAVAEAIRTAVASTAVVIGNDGRLDVTASLGVALGRGDQDNWTQLLASADRALYQAKDEGRNRVVVARRPVTSRVAA